MKIERVGGDHNRVRVMLTGEDLAAMNINVKTLTPNSPELHSFLFKIMERIRIETGFDAINGQVVVEAIPYSDGLILHVSRVAGAVPDTAHKRVTKRDLKSIRVKKKVYPDKIYRFMDFDALCTYFRLIDDDAVGKMRLYGMEGDYYIVSSANDVKIAEFAEHMHAISGEEFLKEHAKPIAEGESFKNMVNAIKNL